MSYQDISSHITEIYGKNISPAAINEITDKIIDKVRDWQQRPLESCYPFIWLDAIYKIRENGRYVNKAVYAVIGVNIRGIKEVLGLYINDTRGANFWLQVLTDLRNRGVEEILIASVDGLKGFPEAIGSIFPNTEVQLCIIHQIRNFIRYVSSKIQKEFMKDLKLVYQAVNEQAALGTVDKLDKKWKDKYPVAISSWRNKWDNLSNYFKYPEEIKESYLYN